MSHQVPIVLFFDSLLHRTPYPRTFLLTPPETNPPASSKNRLQAFNSKSSYQENLGPQAPCLKFSGLHFRLFH